MATAFCVERALSAPVGPPLPSGGSVTDTFVCSAPERRDDDVAVLQREVAERRAQQATERRTRLENQIETKRKLTEKWRQYTCTPIRYFSTRDTEGKSTPPLMKPRDSRRDARQARRWARRSRGNSQRSLRGTRRSTRSLLRKGARGGSRSRRRNWHCFARPSKASDRRVLRRGLRACVFFFFFFWRRMKEREKKRRALNKKRETGGNKIKGIM
ncbi:hypothetical protein C4B63_224g16 [Trypanosoma cruzi]|uniref:Uncharacterized protein n=1 Tax=Trypanosoma cruzi TaxID=5693 RepID=A0A2V2UNT9_TRYCR|nr:hypothetical protein C4B63_224g16 [Trypanosoma cruzi]